MPLESEPVRENNPAPNTGGKTDTQTPQSNPDIPRTPSVPSFPPSKTHYEITCKAEKDFWNHVKTVAEIIGIILLAVYTAYTIKMYRVNKQAADAAKTAADAAVKQVEIAGSGLSATIDQFHLDQRAWVGVRTFDMLPPEVSKPLSIKLAITNSGKTVGTITSTVVTVYPSFSQDIHKYLASHEWRVIQKSRESAPAVPTVVFPGFDFTLPLESKGPVIGDQADLIRSGKVFVYVVGEIYYSDVFGASHNTAFCVMYARTRFEMCREHNSAN
jgi:hypothetical protein